MIATPSSYLSGRDPGPVPEPDAVRARNAGLFPAALLLIIIGRELLNGNISAQVGTLYSRDEAARTRGLAIFSTGIDSGAILRPVAVA